MNQLANNLIMKYCYLIVVKYIVIGERDFFAHLLPLPITEVGFGSHNCYIYKIDR